jgi:hypothetical protein
LAASVAPESMGVYHLYGVSGPIGGAQVGCTIVNCEATPGDVLLPFTSAGLNWLVLDGRSKLDCGALGLTVTY